MRKCRPRDPATTRKSPVDGEYVEAVMPLGEDDARGIREIERYEIGVACEEGAGADQIVGREMVDHVGGFDLFERGELPFSSEAVEGGVIEFRQHQRRDDERATDRLYGFEKEGVVVLVPVKDGKQPAGVNYEGQRPKS